MKIVDIFYPPKCLFCGRYVDSGTYSCKPCADSLPLIIGKVCKRCGAEEESCVCTPVVNRYDGCAAAFYYRDSAKTLVARIKEGKAVKSARLAASFMAAAVKRVFPKISFDLTVPVPRDFFKELTSGDNHAELLARFVAKELGIGFCGALYKKRITVNQKSLSLLKRLSNISGAYGVGRKNKIKNKTVLLVDDVKTTGATLRECAKALKEAGAAKVYCLVLAVTEKKIHS